MGPCRECVFWEQYKPEQDGEKGGLQKISSIYSRTAIIAARDRETLGVWRI